MVTRCIWFHHTEWQCGMSCECSASTVQHGGCFIYSESHIFCGFGIHEFQNPWTLDPQRHLKTSKTWLELSSSCVWEAYWSPKRLCIASAGLQITDPLSGNLEVPWNWLWTSFWVLRRLWPWDEGDSWWNGTIYILESRVWILIGLISSCFMSIYSIYHFQSLMYHTCMAYHIATSYGEINCIWWSPSKTNCAALYLK